MKIKLWGVRGSIPATGPETTIFGGNTSCVEVAEEGWTIILDGGSGIQKLTMNTPIENKRIDILLSHLHLDHIQGLGFFRYFFDPSLEIHIWGPSSSARSLRSRLSRYLSPPLFPVLIRDLPCNLTLHEIDNSTFEIGPFTVTSRFVIHPGPTVGYRVEGKHSVFTYIPDHEPALGEKGIIQNKKWLSGFDLALEADLLLHDAQYTKEEYKNKIGWGHSSIDDAGLFASLTGARHILFAHHDPSRTDIQLNELQEQFRQKHHYAFKNEMAKEGTEYLLK